MAFKGNYLLQNILNFKAFPVSVELSVEVNRYKRDELEANIALQAFKKFPKDLIICDGTLSYKLKNSIIFKNQGLVSWTFKKFL